MNNEEFKVTLDKLKRQIEQNCNTKIPIGTATQQSSSGQSWATPKRYLDQVFFAQEYHGNFSTHESSTCQYCGSKNVRLVSKEMCRSCYSLYNKIYEDVRIKVTTDILKILEAEGIIPKLSSINETPKRIIEI